MKSVNAYCISFNGVNDVCFKNQKPSKTKEWHIDGNSTSKIL